MGWVLWVRIKQCLLSKWACKERERCPVPGEEAVVCWQWDWQAATGKGSSSVCVEGKQGLPVMFRSSVCGQHRAYVQLPALRLPLPMCPPGQDPVQEWV